ncbi:hypothetical protein [Anabaena sp. CCY 9910]
MLNSYQLYASSDTRLLGTITGQFRKQQVKNHGSRTDWDYWW